MTNIHTIASPSPQKKSGQVVAPESGIQTGSTGAESQPVAEKIWLRMKP